LAGSFGGATGVNLRLRRVMRLPIFQVMKRFCLLPVALVILALFPAVLRAADPADAPNSSAAQQEAEERHKQMRADIEALQASNQVLQKRLALLAEELQKLREENSRPTKFATQEDLKYLADKVKEVDKKREEDNEQILKTLTEVKKLLKPQAAPPVNSKPHRTEKGEPGDRTDKTDPAEKSDNGQAQKSVVEKGYWYVVQEKDRLDTIVKAYNDQGIKITLKQVLDANPKLDPKKLIPGKTKIWIPDPSQP
jgi:hypothetical protein